MIFNYMESFLIILLLIVVIGVYLTERRVSQALKLRKFLEDSLNLINIRKSEISNEINAFKVQLSVKNQEQSMWDTYQAQMKIEVNKLIQIVNANQVLCEKKHSATTKIIQDLRTELIRMILEVKNKQ